MKLFIDFIAPFKINHIKMTNKFYEKAHRAGTARDNKKLIISDKHNNNILFQDEKLYIEC
jgi:hypothetical protein